MNSEKKSAKDSGLWDHVGGVTHKDWQICQISLSSMSVSSPGSGLFVFLLFFSRSGF